MNMAKGAESDNVLVPLHEGMVPHTELMQAELRRNMGQNVGEATIFLKLGKLLFEPLDLLAWVLSVNHEPPV